MVAATVIDGKALAAELAGRVGAEVARLRAQDEIVPGLAVILVGDDPASEIYVRNKTRQSEAAGIASFLQRLPADSPTGDVLYHVERLNADPRVHGILVQLPLPPQVAAETVVQAVDPRKDVDGFTFANAGRLVAGDPEAMAPCTPTGCLMMIRSVERHLAGRRALVIGRSMIVGKPMAHLLLAESCTVTIAHSRTVDLADECRRADIVVAAIGRPRFVRGDWIKPGAVVIDVGINRIEEAGRGRVVGDVDFEAATAVAGAITPVPGGVGPMTVACLLRNTLVAACRQNGLPPPAV